MVESVSVCKPYILDIADNRSIYGTEVAACNVKS